MSPSTRLQAADAHAAVPAPPPHLERSADLWRATVDGFELEHHQLELLRRACEASDVADQARATLQAEGLTFTDKAGQPKSHPAVNIERDARLALARLLRELRLDEEPAEPRPPRRGGRR